MQNWCYFFQKYLYNLLMKSSEAGDFLFWTIFNNEFNFSNRHGTLQVLYLFAVFFKKSVYFIYIVEFISIKLSLEFVVMSLFPFLKLLLCLLLFPWSVWTKISILYIFSKKQLFVSLIFFFSTFYLISALICIIFFLLLILGFICSSSLGSYVRIWDRHFETFLLFTYRY